jgi:hypothetical protein
VLVVAAAIRLLVIANYDPTTADSIAAASGVVGTLLGTLVPIVPQVLPVLLLFFIVLRRPLLIILAIAGTALIAPAYASVTAASSRTKQQFINLAHAVKVPNKHVQHQLFISCWRLDRAALIFAAIAILVVVLDKRKWLLGILKIPRLDADWLDKVIFAGFILLVEMVAAIALGLAAGTAYFFVTTIYRIPANMNEIAAIASKPWLPSEIITLKDRTARVGYTLSDNSGWFIFLKQQSRTIEYIPASTVLSRTLCQLSGEERPTQPPLIKLINIPPPRITQCPSG